MGGQHNLRKRMEHDLQNHPHSQHGFTLVEVMVVLVIISILTSLSFVALRGAQVDSDYAKTRATIAKIDSIISERFDEYRTAGLDVVVTGTTLPGGFNTKSYPSHYYNYQTGTYQANGFGAQYTETSGAPESDAKIHSRARLALIRDLMRHEMPDCIGDILVYDSGDYVYRSQYSLGGPPYVFRSDIRLPAGYIYPVGGNPVFVQLNHAPRYEQITSKLVNFSYTRGSDGRACINPVVLETNFNAELLYLVIESSYIAGSYGVEAFAESEIRDTDGDGLKEFVDAWGKPIQWLRWPAGYFDDAERSQLGPSLKSDGTRGLLSRYDPDPLLAKITGVNAFARDDFDPTQADIGYRSSTTADAPGSPLRPLIVSGGLDGLTGLRFFFSGPNAPAGGATGNTATVADATWGGLPWPDPYYPRPSTSTTYDDAYNQSLGGAINTEVDGVDVPIGMNASGSFVYETEQVTNALVLERVSDNATNFDGLGGAL